MRAELTAAELREVLDYDPNTGLFRWKARLSRRAHIGQIAGANHGSGYTEIGIRNVSYLAHRLAWLYMTGEWPKGQIDHKDMSRKNNRWTNLREATHGQNVCNSGPRRNNTTGFKGVAVPGDGKFHARIMVNGTLHLLGRYATPERAHAVYVEAAKRLHGEFFRAR